MKWLNSLRRSREAYELGETLLAAIERGRRLHPWEGAGFQFIALLEEAEELRVALASGNPTRIRAEALDVAVVALRLRDGR